jgi:hypothetical protein
MSQGYISIDSLIREILLNEGRTTLHKYLWYLSYALKSYRQFSIDDSKIVKTVKLQMDNKKAIKFPDDLVTWNKIGLMYRDRVQLFVPDETIALLFEKEGKVYKPNDPWISNNMDVPFEDYYDSNGNIISFSVQAKAYNSIGYYRINEACREIQFSADVMSTSVYIEYVALCASPCNKTYVPIIAMDMIQEAITYYDLKFKYGESDKRTIDQFLTWERERMRYKSRISDLSESGLRNIIFRNTHRFFKI